MPQSGMYILLPLLMLPWEGQAHQDQHRQFQYNSLIDSGTYNFAYDTGSRDASVDAHSLRMEYRDANGIVRGRYGYTDPWGKLRVVEYEAGPNGYIARGDVGPDTYPHSVAPGLTLPQPRPAPTALQMAGWDPVRQPINERTREGTEEDAYPQRVDQPQNYPERVDPQSYPERVDPQSYPERVDPQSYPERVDPQRVDQPQSYPERVDPPETYYPRPVYTPETEVNRDGDVVVFHRHSNSDERRSEPLNRNAPLTIYNIDVDPDEIRVAAPSVPESRSYSRSTTSNVASPQGTSDFVVTSPSITPYAPSPRRRPSYAYSRRMIVNRAYSPRTTSGHFHPPQRSSDHIHTSQRTSDHVHTPQRTPDHVHTPQRTSDHVHTPQRTSDHVHTPQRTSDHVHTPQRTSDHVHTPQRTPNYVYGQRIIDKPRTVNYRPATYYDTEKYYFT